jgi:hypothetical protein
MLSFEQHQCTGWQVEAVHEVLPLSVCNPLGSLEADKGPYAPVLATINLCSDNLTPQLHTPRCVVPRLGALQDPLQSLLETAVWGSSPTAEMPTLEPTFVDPL